MTGAITDDITAIIVNYKTFDLTRQAIWSLHGHYPSLSIVVVDNNSRDGSAEKLQELEQAIAPMELQLNDQNLHHGPGMDQVARLVGTTFFLTFDSDALLYRPGLLEAMKAEITPETYAIGHQIFLDKKGFKTKPDKGIPYVHPFCALFRAAAYKDLPPFAKHGSPCLENEKQALADGRQLQHFPVKKYVYHMWEGTAGKTGHKLGLKSKVDRIIHKLGF